MSNLIARRLFDPRDLNQARLAGIVNKQEAWVQAIKDLKWNLLLMTMLFSGMFIPLVAMSGAWYFLLAIPFCVILLGGQTVSFRVNYLMNPLLYSDLARQRDEIDEFLKEKGYIDS